jgi:hypothetical protein
VPLFALPVPPQPPAVVRCTDADGQVVPQCAKYLYNHRGRSIDARFTGDVRIDLKSDEVVAVPAGASAIIEEHAAGKPARRLTLESGKTSYTVNGIEQAVDASTRKWLREVLSSMPARPVPPAKQSR